MKNLKYNLESASPKVEKATTDLCKLLKKVKRFVVVLNRSFKRERLLMFHFKMTSMSSLRLSFNNIKMPSHISKLRHYGARKGLEIIFSLVDEIPQVLGRKHSLICANFRLFQYNS